MAGRRFACCTCSLKYATKAKLMEHMKSHLPVPKGKREMECSKCSEVFSSTVLLKRHSCCIGQSDNKVDRTEKIMGPEKQNLQNNSKDRPIIKMVSKMQTLLESPKSQLKGIIKTVLTSDLQNKNAASSVNIKNISCLLKKSLKPIHPRKSKSVVPKTSNKVPAKRSTTRSQSKSSKAKQLVKETNIFGDRANKNIDSTTSKRLRSVKAVKTVPQKLCDTAEPEKQKRNKPQNDSKSAGTSAIKTRHKNEATVVSSNKKAVMRTESCLSIPVQSNEASDVANEEVEENQVNGKLYFEEKKLFSCAQCLKTFSRKYHLDRHLRLSPCSGLPPLSFPCEVCDRVYSRKDNLREHLRQHTGESQRVKKHKCTLCDKTFHGQSLLTIHMRTHTGEKPFSCDYCSKKFPSAGALSKHRRTHTGEKPFECEECGHRFSLKGTLKRHLRVHTGVRPHKCSYCGKQFIQIGGLKAHMFYHTGENGFKCEDCGKVFNRKARLQMHNLYVHMKVRPFICDTCPKSFTRKEDLYRHAVLHTGEKPFKCPACPKTFAIKPSLKLHLLTHTKEEPRSCHECGRAFIRKDCLLRHMRKRHRDLLDKILLDEKDEKFGDSAPTSRMLGEEDLCENITELLSLLVEESTLLGFGWPNKPVDEVLEAVIRRCGHTPVEAENFSFMDRMRENAKLLFTVVIDDNAVKTLLNNQTVDEVILHVLRLAKT